MRRFLSLAACALMSCALAACSSGAASDVSTAVTTAEANASGVATNVTTFTQADLQAAIKMARAATPPDTEADSCFSYLSGQLTALQTQIANGTAPVGAASAFEAGNRAARMVTAPPRRPARRS